MWKYFDLNKRAYKDMRPSPLKTMPMNMVRELNELFRRVDMQAMGVGAEKPSEMEIFRKIDELKNALVEPQPPAKLSLIRQIFMYIGIFIGVFFSTAISQFESVQQIDLTLNIGAVLGSAIVAFVIIPVVYQKLNLNPASPFIVQFGLFVQNGVFWHVTLKSIGNVIS